VTVEIGRGPVRDLHSLVELVDLPGTYSLAACSPDERIVVQALAGRVPRLPAPQCVLIIIDASNIARNLYLVSQVLELCLPVVIALNMVDVACARGIEIDADLLSRRLGVPVVPVVATEPESVRPLRAAIEAALAAGAPRTAPELPTALVERAALVDAAVTGGLAPGEALRVLVDAGGCAEAYFRERGGDTELLSRLREELAQAGVHPPVAEVRARYTWVQRMLADVVRRPERPVVTWSDRLDRVLAHKLAGGPILALVLALFFQAIFTGATPLMSAIERAFLWLGETVGAILPAGVLRSLVVDGVITGVGGVLTFLPQILILFGLLAVLEDCGYMARAAYIMDRVMRLVGLSGRSFIPLLSSFACAVPAIMGTRAIADRRERFVTIMIAPFMSCSARLPVYVLMIAAFVPARRYLGGWIGLQGLVMLGAYLVGVVVAIPIAWLLRSTAFAGAGTGFLMLELPTYKRPGMRAIWQRMYLGGRSFVVRAGTIILLVNVLVWALGYFPRDAATRAAVEQKAAAADWDHDRFEAELAGAYLRDSFLGRLGHALEPAIRPLGWDWRIGVGVLASFPAREVIIATLGTVYNLGSAEDESSESLRGAMSRATWPDTGKRVFTLPVALSIMVFFALCAQCSSTLVIMGREMQSWLWPAVSFTGMMTLAYLAALLVSNAARWAGL